MEKIEPITNNDHRDFIESMSGRIHLPTMSRHDRCRLTAMSRGRFSDGDIGFAERKCSTWIRFLNESMSGDEQKITLLRKVVGYTLTGHTLEQKAFVLCGSGHGKTTFLEALHYMMGDYAQYGTGVMSRELYGLLRENTRMLIFEGGFSVQMIEKKYSMAWMTSVIGGDVMVSRKLFSDDLVEIKPQAKIFMTMNTVHDDCASWNRRLKFIEFKNKLSQNDMDYNLLSKLKEEVDGIFLWALLGAREWYASKGSAQPRL